MSEAGKRMIEGMKEAVTMAKLDVENERLRRALAHYACDCEEGECELLTGDIFPCGKTARDALAKPNVETPRKLCEHKNAIMGFDRYDCPDCGWIMPDTTHLNDRGVLRVVNRLPLTRRFFPSLMALDEFAKTGKLPEPPALKQS